MSAHDDVQSQATARGTNHLTSSPGLAGGPVADEHEPVARPARFGPLGERGAAPSQANPIEFLFDIGLKVTVELGRTEMTVRDVLSLGLGSIIELNKVAGEPVDILVNGRPIARGEVVVVDDMFGVRVIDILSPYERVNSLR